MALHPTDEEIRKIRLQLTQLVKALEQMPKKDRGVTGHPTGLCVDSYLTGDDLVFQVDLPGVDQQELKVSVSRNSLTIEGIRPRPTMDDDQTFIMAERPFGSFKRELDLPATVDTSKVEATLKNGLLTVRIPRRPERRGQMREVTIRHLD